MEVPKNCRECMYLIACCSWYGGTGCKYKATTKGGNHECERQTVPADLSEEE